MKLDGLSLEQAPPISVPFRFFLAAPLLGLISAILLVLMGEESLMSRWTPGMLAITHGVVLGVFATVMFGALLQMLPVLAGAVIPSPRRLGNILLPLWVVGILALQCAFLKGEGWLFLLAVVLLGAAVIIFVTSCGTALFRATSQIDSVLGMKLALLSLIITLILGMMLGLGHIGLLPLLRPLETNVHAMWGLLGWIGLLVVSVAWQVVPMFQITAAYPKQIVRLLAPSLFGLFLLRSLLVLMSSFFLEKSPLLPVGFVIVDILISLLLVTFSLQTLWLQYKRKRKISDGHIHYWRIGCVCLVICIFCWWAARLIDNPVIVEYLALLSVVLFIAGFVMAIMTGMLYKIVAFLVWFHLQGLNTRRMMAGEGLIQVPHMKAVISEKRIILQLRIFLLALLLIPVLLVWPALYWLTGILWALHFGLMAYHLGGAATHYRRVAFS
ncbi:MAG: hypothetical protein K9K86_04705 [Pseudomonadales bacterium]|nr:hypothetical protein [Pseudomonadales bacterium]